jgi:N-acetylglucosaminyldiphosphoundecaprenol N-acetyl-beta-D-mannosaminyltransferase
VTVTTNSECVDRVNTAQVDDLSREVYCILGVPIDAIEMPGIMQRIEMAAADGKPFVISTPNLNFLVSSQAHLEFRESLLASNLCPADGMPIVWIARLVGIPIRNRVAGSDIFQMLKVHHDLARPLKVFFFGGAEGVAAKACNMLDEERCGLRCVGTMYPGFGSIEELSRDEIIKTINASGADFLVASLGALKGQLWLLRNQHRLQIPIRAHFGAVVNFQAGVIRRAPRTLRKYGLEWLWRIKEEPYLWRRYFDDGTVLLRVLVTRIFPLAIWTRTQQFKYRGRNRDLHVKQVRDNETVTLSLYGFATGDQVATAIPYVRDAVAGARKIIIDLSGTSTIDPRFFGFLFMLRKLLKEKGITFTFTGLSSRLKKMFRLNGVSYLLAVDDELRSS